MRKNILFISILLITQYTFGLNKCVGESLTQPINSACFSMCSSPSSGTTWSIVFSGTYTITNPSSIAGTYTGNQTLTTTIGDFCQNIAITFDAGTGACSITSSASCGQRNENHTISDKPTIPTGGYKIHNINAGNCIDLTAQGRTCATGILKWCVNNSSVRSCVDVTTPSNYCPSSTVVVYAYCHDASANAACQNSDYVNDSIVVSSTTSIDESKGQLFSVFPNPTTNVLNIKTSLSTGNYKIYNILGEIKEDGIIYSNNTTIDISTYKKGTYYILYDDGIKDRITRFLKQ